MKKVLFIVVGALFVSFSGNASSHHHNLNIKVDVENHTISVIDTIEFLRDAADLSFYLNSALKIESANATYTKSEEGRIEAYKISNINHSEPLIIRYKGELKSDEYSTIEEKGVYLSMDDYWIPYFSEEGMFTFKVKLEMPKGWLGVTNGERTDNEGPYQCFECKTPSNQISLSANKWTVYSRVISDTKISVFLINPDEALAQKYLGVTGQYLQQYAKQIGEFPYPKFDVIENFRETGFGLPSFTLLGQKVIRLPWILFTSYPHELLHNYWGNSVYVDYKTGNWCEGITTYMADFMLKDQEGEGVAFRRSMLQKYTNYVTPENDFPAREFKSKTDEVSDAVGYSKVFMMNQMLRTQFGDTAFFNAYRTFYQNNRYKVAGFDEIKRAFEQETGNDLDWFFEQWINKTGAPLISVTGYNVKSKKLEVTLAQSKISEVFKLHIPVRIHLDNGAIQNEVVKLDKGEQSFCFKCKGKPTKVEVDPNFEVMRMLDNREVPPTLSKLMGAQEWTVVLPAKSDEFEMYQAFASQWKLMYARRGKTIDIVKDTELENLNNKSNVWILGEENGFKGQASVKNIYGDDLTTELYTQIADVCNKGTLCYVVNGKATNDQTIGFIESQNSEQLMALLMKMMHYGNNSYIGFEGNEMNNSLKGLFPVVESPLMIQILK